LDALLLDSLNLLMEKKMIATWGGFHWDGHSSLLKSFLMSSCVWSNLWTSVYICLIHHPVISIFSSVRYIVLSLYFQVLGILSSLYFQV